MKALEAVGQPSKKARVVDARSRAAAKSSGMETSRGAVLSVRVTEISSPPVSPVAEPSPRARPWVGRTSVVRNGHHNDLGPRTALDGGDCGDESIDEFEDRLVDLGHAHGETSR